MATHSVTSNPSLVNNVVNGVIGGAAGGVVFGIMMGVQGMLPMVAALIGANDALVGFVVHMAISVFIGVTFGVIASRLPSGLPLRTIGGGVYGIVWWVLGALILMPLMLGMNEMVFVIGEMQISSLIGHLIFGVIMGVVYHFMAARRA